MLVTSGAVFLTMFAGIVVLSTLLIMRPAVPQAQSVLSATQFDEPALPEVTEAVTRAELDILQPQPAEAEVTQVAASAAPRLRPEHRYRVPGCIDHLDTLVKISTVRFATASDKPVAADMIRARAIATAVATCDEVKVIVEGHSDRKGSDKLNMELSWFRAQSVIDKLQQEGFDVAALQPRGFGATRPINLSGTISGEAENRRVQFALAPRAAPPVGQATGN